MTKFEAIVLGITIMVIFFLKYDLFTSISNYLSYIFFILFLGFSIAPEIESKAFKSPKLFQIGVGLVSGIIAGNVLHSNYTNYLAIIAICICIAILAPVWIKILEHA